MLCHQMLSLAMDSYFSIVISTSYNSVSFSLVKHYMPRKCISANLTIQSSKHQIFTHLYLTVSIRPSYMESLTGFSQAPPPSNGVTPHFTINLSLLLPTQYFFIRTLKKIEKQIHNLLSRETIPNHCTCTLTCYSLGH